jgi:hypothetical protein
VDDPAVEIVSRKAGNPMFTGTDIVSVDGNTLMQVMKDRTAAEAVNFESDFRHIAPARADDHAVLLAAGYEGL